MFYVILNMSKHAWNISSFRLPKWQFVLVYLLMCFYFTFAENVQLSDIDLNTVTVSWVVPYTPTFQQYTVVYGLEPDALDQSHGPIYSSLDLSVVNQTFSVTLQGLTQGTDYYLRVSSTFGYNVIYSDLVSFTTLDPRKSPIYINLCSSVFSPTQHQLVLHWISLLTSGEQH